MQTALDPSQYYRLPWTLNDNIPCDGCPDMTVHVQERPHARKTKAKANTV